MHGQTYGWSRMRMIHGILPVVFLVLAGASCTTTTKPRPTILAPCVSEQQRELVLRWGTEDDSTHTTYAYIMNTKGEIFHVKTDGSDPADTSYVNAATPAEFCSRAEGVKTAFLKTQAMNVRGVRARYIEYVSPKTDVYLRVVWNPDIPTFQSRFFRAEFDSLQRLVTSDR